jgi:AraC-like DNA-binding protein
MPLANDSSDEERQYDRWVSTNVGQVIATMLDLQPTQSSIALRVNLQRCVSQTNSTRHSFSNLAKAAPSAFLQWISGRIKPTLDHLCRLSYQLEVPLIMLFKEVPDEWRGPEQLRQQIDQKDKVSAPPVIAASELRHSLAAALSENPPPSVAEIARRLKFRRADTLRYREPDLCRLITARWRASGTLGNVTQLYKKSEKQGLEKVLRRYLARQGPPSLDEIAFQLGYKNSGTIHDRFPELCRAIAAKRDQQKRKKMQLALEHARRESPPPSLRQIARRLRLTSSKIITRTCPEMCASYKQWRELWLDEQRKKLQISIREWLAAEPAPTVASLCRHFGIHVSYFRWLFPAENREVVQQTVEHARAARENRVVIMRKEILKIVGELYAKNLYPSISQGTSALSQGLPRRSPLVRTFIEGAISQFGSVMRSQNELARLV